MHCAGDKILIPIHGYPVVNQEVDRLLPPILDFGKNSINQEYKKSVFIQCTVPVNFEFEFRMLQHHPDIQVVPIRGDIFGLSKTKIDFFYRPTSYTTACAEYMFKTSEFNSTAIKVAVTACAETETLLVKREEYVPTT